MVSFARRYPSIPAFRLVMSTTAFAFSNKGDLPKQWESLDKALALFPNFAEPWLGRGNALRELSAARNIKYGRAVEAAGGGFVS